MRALAVLALAGRGGRWQQQGHERDDGQDTHADPSGDRAAGIRPPLAPGLTQRHGALTK